MEALTVAEWIAIVSLAFTLIFGIAKFYAMFTKMDHTLSELNETIKELKKNQTESSNRLSIIEEQIRSIFKQIGKERK